MPSAPFKSGEAVTNDVSQATETMILALRIRAGLMHDGPLALGQIVWKELTCANRSVLLTCQEVKGKPPTVDDGSTPGRAGGGEAEEVRYATGQQRGSPRGPLVA